MKGKKSDPVFVASFIAESIQQGIVTPEAMLERARASIVEIDEQIKTIEAKKTVRSKLLDVVGTFEKSQDKKTADELPLLLPKFQFDYPVVCYSICSELIGDEYGLTFDSLFSRVCKGGKGSDYLNAKFSIKQLLLAKVIRKTDKLFFQGDNFNKYMQIDVETK